MKCGGGKSQKLLRKGGQWFEKHVVFHPYLRTQKSILSIWDVSRSPPHHRLPHVHAQKSPAFFFWLWRVFCIFKTMHCFLFVCSFPWSLPNDTRASQLPSTRIWVCPQLCLPTVLDFCSLLFCVLSCSLSLEPFPVLGNSWEKLTHNTGGLGETFLQLFLTLWTCAGWLEESTSGTAFLLVLESSTTESHQVENPLLEKGVEVPES